MPPPRVQRRPAPARALQGCPGPLSWPGAAAWWGGGLSGRRASLADGPRKVSSHSGGHQSSPETFWRRPGPLETCIPAARFAAAGGLWRALPFALRGQPRSAHPGQTTHCEAGRLPACSRAGGATGGLTEPVGGKRRASLAAPLRLATRSNATSHQDWSLAARSLPLGGQAGLGGAGRGGGGVDSRPDPNLCFRPGQNLKLNFSV